LKIAVNGKTLDTQDQTVFDLLRSNGLENRMVVVEIDGEIVPKEKWAETGLREGMKIEIVHFVGGG
jgi:thiamine biosynthesis protein ThiS